MTLKNHNALWYANRAILWLNGKSWATLHSDRVLSTSYRLSIVTMSPVVAVSLQLSMTCFKL